VRADTLARFITVLLPAPLIEIKIMIVAKATNITPKITDTIIMLLLRFSLITESPYKFAVLIIAIII
jgi:hypothetical protein